MTLLASRRFALLLAACSLAACSTERPLGPPPSAALNLAAEEPDTGEVFIDLTGEALASEAVESGRGAGSIDDAAGARTMQSDAPATLGAGPATLGAPIRIGVVPAAALVRIGAASDFEIRNKTTGALLMTGSDEQVDVTLGTGSVSTSSRRLQAGCPSSVSGRDALVAAGNAAGYPTLVQQITSPITCFRVFIGERPLPANTAAELAYKTQVRAAVPSVPADAFWRTVTITVGVTEYRVTRGALTVVSTAPVVLTAAGGITTIGTTLGSLPYRGTAEVIRSSGAAPAVLAGVNILPIEEYLYGVVPRELPPTIWNQLEAQKSQAVAARTYATAGRGKRGADGYDLLATTTDQVYGGYSAEHPLSTQAIQETAGLVATYGGKLIQALYSSTSGGYSAANEEAFNSAPVPYLRSVRDKHFGNSEQHGPSLDDFRNAPNPHTLRASREGDYGSDWSRYHRWTFEWTAEEISSVISAYAGVPVGKVLAINVLERGASGRVTLIEYVTENGTFTDTRDRIRTSLKFINSAGTMSSLLSTLFYIEPVLNNRTKEVSGFVAYGGGWGHGVGMSQTGAAGMAEKGATFEEILKRYYYGIDLTQWY